MEARDDAWKHLDCEEENAMVRRLTISDASFMRLIQFKKVAEAVVDREITDENWLELVLARGVNGIVEDLLEPQTKEILIESFQQLAQRYPAEVSEYMADILQLGEESIREAAKRKLGFELPEDETVG